MALPDYIEFLDPLKIPIRGKEYVIPPISFETGLRLTPLTEGVEDAKKLIGNDESFYRTALGTAYAEMVADSVPNDAIFRAVLTAWTDFKAGRGAAEIMWKTGGDPKAIQALTDQANRATRRKAQKRSTSTGAANTTKRPASTSGTKTSPQKS